MGLKYKDVIKYRLEKTKCEYIKVSSCIRSIVIPIQSSQFLRLNREKFSISVCRKSRFSETRTAAFSSPTLISLSWLQVRSLSGHSPQE